MGIGPGSRPMPSDCLAPPHYRQEHDWSCTPACVRMVLAYHGHVVSEDVMTATLGSTTMGTPFHNLARLEDLGFKVRIESGSVSDLRLLTARGTPCIARVMTIQLPRYPLPPWVRHTLVVVGVSRSRVFYHDPAHNEGPDEAPIERFASAWAAGRREFAIIVPG